MRHLGLVQWTEEVVVKVSLLRVKRALRYHGSRERRVRKLGQFATGV